jgi:hypothetical protein
MSAGEKKSRRIRGGTGIVSFYSRRLRAGASRHKLSTINSALIKNVVKGGNTASTSGVHKRTAARIAIIKQHQLVRSVCNGFTATPCACRRRAVNRFVQGTISEEALTAYARACTVSENGGGQTFWNSNVGYRKAFGARTRFRQRSPSPRRGLVVPLKAIEMFVNE